MLTILSGKYSLFEDFHFLIGPAAAALRSLEIVFVSLKFNFDEELQANSI